VSYAPELENIVSDDLEVELLEVWSSFKPGTG